MTVTQPKADVTEIKRALDVLFQPGDVVELRALDVGGKVHAGYFSDFDRLANEAARLSGQAAGVYVVLNQVNRDLLSRSQNRITVVPKNLTQDADITRRRWLPIDADAKRPSGISSTDQEHVAAIATAKGIKSYLTELGFSANSILTGDSGNGAHVLVRVDLPNDAETKTLIESCIKAVAAKFDSDKVMIDQTVFNAARIWKLPGTMARKGDSTETRPHRIARLLDVPATITTAPIESVKALAATAPEPEAPRQSVRTHQGGGQPFDLESWIAKNGIEVKSTGPYEGGSRYILKACPFNPEHTGTSVAVFQTADGALGFKCQHSSCANRTWADLRELKEPGYRDRKNGHRDYKSDTTLPIIVVGDRQLRDLTTDGLQALEAANKPKPSLFRFGPGLARIGHDDRHRPFTEQASETIIQYQLSKCATFTRYDAEGNPHDCLPPLRLSGNILVAGADWHFPPVLGIVEAPTLRPDFTIIGVPGYDAQTGLYLEPSRGLAIPPVPERPTDSELQDAIYLVQEPLCDFPFVDQASRANMTAAILLSCVRDAITGPVPLTLVTKPQPGCGGSLSIESVAIIATGRPAHMIPATRDPEEWRKLLTSLLLSGDRYVIFDNLDHTLESEYLAVFLTALVWKDRILGLSQPIQLPNRTVCFANGNNARVGGNLARRIVPVRLDSPEARPWLRNASEFKHPKLREWLTENRGRIIAAILTIARGWVNAGKPSAPDGISLGSFESYSQIVGGFLSFMGVKGFLGNLEELYSRIDADTPAWANFFEVWQNEVGPEPITVADLVCHLKDNVSLKAALPDTVADWESKDGVAKGYTRRLGNQLAKREGQKFDNGLILTRAGEKDRAVRWKVMSFEKQTHTNLGIKMSLMSFGSSLRGNGLKKEENKKCKGPDINSLNSFSSVESMSLVPDDGQDKAFLAYTGLTRQELVDRWTAKGKPAIPIVQGQSISDLPRFLENVLDDTSWAALNKWVEDSDQ